MLRCPLETFFKTAISLRTCVRMAACKTSLLVLRASEGLRSHDHRARAGGMGVRGGRRTMYSRPSMSFLLMTLHA